MPPISRPRQTVLPGVSPPASGATAEEGPTAVGPGASPGGRSSTARAGNVLMRAAEDLPTGAPLATGIDNLDEFLGGGLPRGALSEVNAPNSAGAMSLALRIAARTTGEGRWVAWIDPTDVLDPGSLETVGVDMRGFLWVRPAGERAALATAEILAGLENAFALVVLDLTRPWGRRRLAGGAYRSRPPASLATRASGTLFAHDGNGGAIHRASGTLLAHDGDDGALPRAASLASRAGGTRPAHWLRLAATLRQGRADVALLVLGGDIERSFSPACALRLEIVPVRTRWSGTAADWRLLGAREVEVHVRRRRNGFSGGSIRFRLAAVRSSRPRATAAESTGPDTDKIWTGRSTRARTEAAAATATNNDGNDADE